MELAVVGIGYVGLVTALGFASRDHKVTCIDCDGLKVNKINQGTCSFYEPGLDGLLSRCVEEKHTLKATEDFNEIAYSDATFICVGTFSESNGKTDFKHIIDVASQIGRELQKTNSYHLVVVKSTVIPGTTKEIIIPALERYSSKKAGREFGVAVNPEFLQEGNAVQCFQNPEFADSGEIGHVSAPNRPPFRSKPATPKRAWGVALGADSLTQFTGHLQQPPFPRFSCFPPMTLCAWNHL